MTIKEGIYPSPKFHAMAWANAVRVKSGMRDTAIEKKFMGDGCCKIVDGRLKTPRLFTKYANGQSAPIQVGNRCGGMDLVDRIEEKFPNTKAWLYHPLWKMLNGNLTLPEIWQIMVNCEIDNLLDFFDRTLDGSLIRTGNVGRDKLIKLLNSKSYIDVLTFLIGLIKEAEIRLDVRLHRTSVSMLLILIPKFFNDPIIKNFAGTLFDFIESKYFRVSYAIPDSGAELIFTMSWRERHKDISEHLSSKNSFLQSSHMYRPLFRPLYR